MSNTSDRYYLIYVSTFYNNDVLKYIASSLEDAESHTMEFADFKCNYGTVSIKEIDNYSKTYNRYFYVNGKRASSGEYWEEHLKTLSGIE